MTEEKEERNYFDGFLDTLDEKGKPRIHYTRIPKEIFDCRLSPNAVSIYCYLMNCVNWKEHGDSRAFPAIPTIIEKSGVKKGSISKAVDELVQAGWINNIVRRMDKSNVYFMNLEPSIIDDLITKREIISFTKKTVQKKISANRKPPERKKDII